MRKRRKRRSRSLANLEEDSRLPGFKEQKISHKKKAPEDLVNGNYTDDDLDKWAAMIQSGRCTYEGVASVFPVSVGTLHRR